MKCLLFFPNNPVPVRSGSHRRFFEVVAGLRELGYQIHLVSTEFTSDRPWDEESVQTLRIAGIHRVWLPRRLPAAERLLRRYHKSVYGRTLEWSHLIRACVPNSLRDYFQRVAEAVCPEATLIFYGAWAGLLSDELRAASRTVVDINDLMSRNHRMQAVLRPHFDSRPLVPAKIPSEFLCPDMYGEGYPLADGEIESLDWFQGVMALAEPEARELREKCQRAQIHFVPIAFPSSAARSDFSGDPVFFGSENLFNLQGYCFLLPLMSRCGSDFRVVLRGQCGSSLQGQSAFHWGGPSATTEDVYRRASFAVCPTFGGTGEQTKITEAMSHGVPVVALAAGIRGAPVRHGENGLVARDGEEFAEHCRRLWSDRDLCRRLGEAAYETVRSERSKDGFVEGLGRALS